MWQRPTVQEIGSMEEIRESNMDAGQISTKVPQRNWHLFMLNKVDYNDAYGKDKLFNTVLTTSYVHGPTSPSLGRGLSRIFVNSRK